MTKSKQSSLQQQQNIIIMDHIDLIKELPQIERMTNQERLKLAHKRRKLQLKNWTQQEKLWILNTNNSTTTTTTSSNLNPPKIPFNKEASPLMYHYGISQQQLQQQQQQKFNKKKRKKNINRIRFKNSIMLLEAAGRNDIDEVKRLLDDGVDADVCNEDGLTALHQCCIDDNEELLKLLLGFGANVNAEDSEKWTPLHAAATCGHLHLVKHLIINGANLLAVNAEGNMPYDICDEEGTLDFIESEMAARGVTQELIEDIRALPETRMLQDMEIIAEGGGRHGDLYSCDQHGATYLHIAAANGWIRVVEFLLDHHISTDVQDKDYWQPIHAAACWGHIDVLELLIQNGADLNARTKNNETPYAICEDPEMKEKIIQLRSELETKMREDGGNNKNKIRRSQSSNSRTQSIRRTSQRDKSLTSKRDVADEAAQKLFITSINKDNSPSPSIEYENIITIVDDDKNNKNNKIHSNNDDDIESSCSEEDEEEKENETLKNIPVPMEIDNTCDISSHSSPQQPSSPPPPLSSSSSSLINNILINVPPVITLQPQQQHSSTIVNINNNNTPIKIIDNIHSIIPSSSLQQKQHDNFELPIPDINSTIENIPTIVNLKKGGGGGGDDEMKRNCYDGGSGGSNTIDIHVQVTINNNTINSSSPQQQQHIPSNNIPLVQQCIMTTTNDNSIPSIPIPIPSIPILSNNQQQWTRGSSSSGGGGGGTLADLKKQRLLQYNTTAVHTTHTTTHVNNNNRNNSIMQQQQQSNNNGTFNEHEEQSKYYKLNSPTLSRFSGTNIIDDSSNIGGGGNSKKCCIII